MFLLIQAVMGVVCAVVIRTYARIFHWGFPYSTAFLPFGHWYDFGVYWRRLQHFHSSAFFSTQPEAGTTFEYPAPMAVVYKAFYSAGSHPLKFFLFLTAALVLVLAAVLVRGMVQRGVHAFVAVAFVTAMLALSFPLWFEFRLGNMEIVPFLLVAAAILAYLRGYPVAAAILIGLAASLKIFPAVYLALFFSRKQYRLIAIAVLTAIVFNVGSLWLVDPAIGESYRGIAAGLAENRVHYMRTYLVMETAFDHSLFGFFKRTVLANRATSVASDLALTAYLGVAALGGLALYFLRIRKLPWLNQLVCLCVASILLPPTSHDYTLLYLYIPFSLLVLYLLADSRRQALPGITAAIVCFALLFSPQSELIHAGEGFSGQFKCLVLIALLLLALSKPWADDPALVPAPR